MKTRLFKRFSSAAHDTVRARLLLAAGLCWLTLAAACADVWLVALLLTLAAGAVVVWCWLAPDADQEAQP